MSLNRRTACFLRSLVPALIRGLTRDLKFYLAKAALKVLQLVGVVGDNYRTEDSCLISLSMPFDSFGALTKEILRRIVATAHPDATVVRFRGPKGDEFRCLLP